MRWQLFADRDDGETDGLAEDPPFPDSDAAFWASPVGSAARAKLRGDRFFQIELDDATLSAYAESSAPAHGRRARRTCDLLGQIEELGWHLEHATWWRVDTDGADAGADVMHSHLGVDHVRGVYLFHSLPGADEGAAVIARASHAAVHAPTHRLDVS